MTLPAKIEKPGFRTTVQGKVDATSFRLTLWTETELTNRTLRKMLEKIAKELK